MFTLSSSIEPPVLKWSVSCAFAREIGVKFADIVKFWTMSMCQRQAEISHDVTTIRVYDNGTISSVIQPMNQSRVPSSRPRTDVRPNGKDTRSNPEHKVEQKR